MMFVFTGSMVSLSSMVEVVFISVLEISSSWAGRPSPGSQISPPTDIDNFVSLIANICSF